MNSKKKYRYIGSSEPGSGVNHGDVFHTGTSYRLMLNDAGTWELFETIFNEDILLYITPAELKKYFEEVADE